MNQDEKTKCIDCLKRAVKVSLKSKAFLIVVDEIESVEDLAILIHADSIQEIQFCRNCAEKALETGNIF